MWCFFKIKISLKQNAPASSRKSELCIQKKLPTNLRASLWADKIKSILDCLSKPDVYKGREETQEKAGTGFHA